MAERSDAGLVWWARALDAVGVGLILIGLSVTVTGGFREWFPFGRISVTSWIRPMVIGGVLLLIRHYLRREPTIVRRVAEAFHRWRTSSEARVIWPIFLSSRLGVLAVGFLGVALIGYAPNTPPWRIYENEFFNLPARWDAGWYLGVATDGYLWNPDYANQQQNLAFFPALPMLMRYGSLFLARQTLWVAVVVAFVAFFFALRYTYRIARLRLDHEQAVAAIALLAAYPFALFFSAPYTESLFLLTTVAAIYHFERGEFSKAGVWGLAAGLTRPNGCLLSIPLALLAVQPVRRDWRAALPRLAAAAMPGVGMLLYSAYIYTLTGNPLQWVAANAAWGRVYRGVDDLVGARVNYLQHYGFYNYATNQTLDFIQAAAVIFVLVSLVPVVRRFGTAYAALILVTVLPPLVMGGLLSMGRVTSVVFPTFLWLGAALPPAHRTGWLVGFAMLQGLCAIAFFTWRPLY
jgi:hypothetical protein